MANSRKRKEIVVLQDNSLERKQNEEFDLDKETDDSSLTLSQLSPSDFRHFILLCLLYLLQGVPVGLAFGSIPFLLKSSLSYGQVGIFSLASYPYSLKLLWSPIVDAVFSTRLGRRKSWIIPIQTLSALILIILSYRIGHWMEHAEANLIAITSAFFLLVMLCATQDIAVDGWALNLLSTEALSYASTAQTIGLNTGYFLSFTVFLAFNSPEFANKYFRSVPLEEGLISLGGYLRTWGWIYLALTAWLLLFTSEQKSNSSDGISSVYRSMYKIMRLPHVQLLLLAHLTAKFAFQTNEAATNLKLLEKGFSKEDLALTVLIDFPLEIVFGYYAAKWSTGNDPLQPWIFGYSGRVLAAMLSHFTVWIFPSDGHVGWGYFLWVILVHVFGSFMSTIQFVSMNAFHTLVSDPQIGGTYMTLLNTLSNLGGTWPRLFIMEGVDYFTTSYCSVNPTMECHTDPGLIDCPALGGECIIVQDGYYYMNALCVIVGIVLFYTFLKPTMSKLQSLPLSKWKIT